MMNWKWTVALTIVATSLCLPQSWAKERKESREADEFDREIKYANLPEPVKATVDRERRNHEVKSFWHVKRDGKEFYRAVIDTKGDDTVIRIRPGGDLLTEQEARDTSYQAKRGGSATGSGSTGGARRSVVLAPGETEGDVLEFDRLPGAVKTEIGRLAKSDRVHEVVKYQHRGHTMYRAEVGEGPYRHYIRVGEAGKVESVRGDIDPGKAVPFDRTPGAVKSKIGSLARSGKVEEVIEYERGGKTYYQAQVEDKGGKNRFITVDAGGREVDALPAR